jgi:hypothetical protein
MIILKSALGVRPASFLTAKPWTLNSDLKYCARSVAHQLPHQGGDSDESEEEEEDYDDADNGNNEVNTLNLKIDGIHEVEILP